MEEPPSSAEAALQKLGLPLLQVLRIYYSQVDPGKAKAVGPVAKKYNDRPDAIFGILKSKYGRDVEKVVAAAIRESADEEDEEASKEAAAPEDEPSPTEDASLGNTLNGATPEKRIHEDHPHALESTVGTLPNTTLVGAVAVNEETRSETNAAADAEPSTSKEEERQSVSQRSSSGDAYDEDVDDDPETVKRDLYHQRLTRFYHVYAPEKLPTIGQALFAYRGREEEMFRTLEAKYGPEPSPSASHIVMPAKPIEVVDAPPSASTTENPPAQSEKWAESDWASASPAKKDGNKANEPQPKGGITASPSPRDYRTRLLWLYLEYCPDRILNADVVLFSYRGREEQMMRDLVLLFGPEPDLAERKARLESFYRYYCPDKIQIIDDILLAYAGDMDELFGTLVSQYGMEPVRSQGSARGNVFENSSRSVSGEAVAASDSPGADVSFATTTRQRLIDFYEFYAPEKVDAVDDVLVAYTRGGEDHRDLFRLLQEKYGPEPAKLRANRLHTAARQGGVSPGSLSPMPLPSPAAHIGRSKSPSGYSQLLDSSDIGWDSSEASETSSMTSESRVVAYRRRRAESVKGGKLPWLKRVEGFLTFYAPDEVRSAEAMLQPFIGREKELLKKLCQQYGPEPTPQQVSEVQRLLATIKDRQEELELDAEVERKQLGHTTKQTETAPFVAKLMVKKQRESRTSVAPHFDYTFFLHELGVKVSPLLTRDLRFFPRCRPVPTVPEAIRLPEDSDVEDLDLPDPQFTPPPLVPFATIVAFVAVFYRAEQLRRYNDGSDKARDFEALNDDDETEGPALLAGLTPIEQVEDLPLPKPADEHDRDAFAYIQAVDSLCGAERHLRRSIEKEFDNSFFAILMDTAMRYHYIRSQSQLFDQLALEEKLRRASTAAEESAFEGILAEFTYGKDRFDALDRVPERTVDEMAIIDHQWVTFSRQMGHLSGESAYLEMRRKLREAAKGGDREAANALRQDGRYREARAAMNTNKRPEFYHLHRNSPLKSGGRRTHSTMTPTDTKKVAEEDTRPRAATASFTGSRAQLKAKGPLASRPLTPAIAVEAESLSVSPVVVQQRIPLEGDLELPLGDTTLADDDDAVQPVPAKTRPRRPSRRAIVRTPPPEEEDLPTVEPPCPRRSLERILLSSRSGRYLAKQSVDDHTPAFSNMARHFQQDVVKERARRSASKRTASQRSTQSVAAPIQTVRKPGTPRTALKKPDVAIEADRRRQEEVHEGPFFAPTALHRGAFSNHIAVPRQEGPDHNDDYHVAAAAASRSGGYRESSPQQAVVRDNKGRRLLPRGRNNPIVAPEDWGRGAAGNEGPASSHNGILASLRDRYTH